MKHRLELCRGCPNFMPQGIEGGKEIYACMLALTAVMKETETMNLLEPAGFSLDTLEGVQPGCPRWLEYVVLNQSLADVMDNEGIDSKSQGERR